MGSQPLPSLAVQRAESLAAEPPLPNSSPFAQHSMIPLFLLSHLPSLCVSHPISHSHTSLFNILFSDPSINCEVNTVCYSGDILDTKARNWLQTTKDEPDERDRLMTLATDVIRAFKRDELKDAKSVTEVVSLASVLENDDFRYLIKEFYSGIGQSGLLDLHQLEGLARLIQSADKGYLDSDDLVKVLTLLSTRLRDTHQQSTTHIYQLTVAVSHVLDAMADADVKGLSRENIHEPLSAYLYGLKGSKDPYLIYQAAYAYQALLCVPDDESLWQATLRRTGKVVQGVSGLVSAVKGLDLNGFIEGLGDIQKGLAGASEMVRIVKTAYEGAMSVAEDGRGFFECLQEGLSFNRKCAWYSALRGADMLILNGELAEFRKLVCEAPCRRDAAFQWGVCQRLGEVAANTAWDVETRRSAIAFLVEIYQNDTVWGDQANVKQWVVNILMQLASLPGGEMQFIEARFQELRKNGDATKQILYQTCRENGPGLHSFKVASPELALSSSLLDRVQERPDVEGSLRQLRRQRLKERGNVVYIHPQAKAGLQSPDEAASSLMEKVEEFLSGDQEVFLLLGDSGAGKSSFNRELECHLWKSYKKSDVIPLHINLPAIEKPEHDMIAKQLRKVEFTEPQIRELKLNRKFILICDGYDESQQTQNLYTSNRLNQEGGWNAKMIISCRSEYLGVDYRDRFQPGDRNRPSDPSSLQEAVITPFSMSQVHDYITQYVSVNRPLWEAEDYIKALDLIPSLKELVKNPFLMSLSLEVIPRMVDPGQDLSAARITRMALYDQFIDHWLERGKKRIGEKKLSPQAKSAFESLIDEGFTRNGIDHLKRLSVAIYKEQDGQPIVTYSRYKDENSWKAPFFSREEEKQLLREACPLIRNGNQHRFIHRSLLEYGVALAIFDPYDWKERKVPKSTSNRRNSVSSVVSYGGRDLVDEISDTIEQELDINSPLAWRHFISEPSVLQFLEERVQHESLFKQQLLRYIERSKGDKKWRIAASNSITILVRAGVQFIGADLRGIQVPNADLSYGMFDSAQFEEADLRQVDLHGAWLRKANLNKAQMSGVQFGELPYLEHDSVVTKCIYSPDGKTIAAGLEDGNICLYSTSSWERQWASQLGHDDVVRRMAYSPKSNQIASGGDDCKVRLWDVQTGDCLHVLNAHDSWITGVAYSPQGGQVASTSHDGRVKIWDVRTGDCCHISVGHTTCRIEMEEFGVMGVVYSPNDNGFASFGADGTVRLCGVEMETFHVLRGHTYMYHITSVAYSPQGDQLVSASTDSTVRLWVVVTGYCRHIFTGHSDCVRSVAYSPKGNRVASASEDHTARLWDVETGRCLHILHGHNSMVRETAFSPQGDVVISVGDDHTVRLWDAETGASRQTFAGHSHWVLSVVFSPKGDQVASGSVDKTVRLWDIGARASRHPSHDSSDPISHFTCSPSGDSIATCGVGMVHLWDVKTGVRCQTFQGPTREVLCVMYSPQGDQIATGHRDNAVRLWNSETGTCQCSLEGHNDRTGIIAVIAYSPRGDQIASSSNDYSVRLRDVRSGECLHILIGHTDSIRNIMYSPSGSQVVSSSWGDSLVRIWDAQTGLCIHTLTAHSDSVCKVVYSPHGSQIASASYDSTVRIWDAETGECLHIFIGHKVSLATVTYSPGGDQITSGDSDGSLRVWDIGARSCLWTLTGHNSEIIKLQYSSQGDLLISSDCESVRLWDVPSGQCRAVIQDLLDVIQDVVWTEVPGFNYLVIGCYGGLMGRWRVEVIKDHCFVSVCWMITMGVLNVNDATIQGAQGLSQLDKQLLKQRGAVGEPDHRFREAGKILATMASAVSKLKNPENRAQEGPSFTSSALAKDLDEKLQQVKDSLFQDMMAMFVKNIHERE